MQQLKSILNALISLILHFWLLLEKAVYHKLHKSVMQPSSCGGNIPQLIMPGRWSDWSSRVKPACAEAPTFLWYEHPDLFCG